MVKNKVIKTDSVKGTTVSEDQVSVEDNSSLVNRLLTELSELKNTVSNLINQNQDQQEANAALRQQIVSQAINAPLLTKGQAVTDNQGLVESLMKEMDTIEAYRKRTNHKPQTRVMNQVSQFDDQVYKINVIDHSSKKRAKEA